MIIEPFGDQVGVAAYRPLPSLNTLVSRVPSGAIVQITPCASANKILVPSGEPAIVEAALDLDLGGGEPPEPRAVVSNNPKRAWWWRLAVRAFKQDESFPVG